MGESSRWRFVGLRVRTLVLAGYADFAWIGGKTVVFTRIPKTPIPSNYVFKRYPIPNKQSSA